VIAIIDYGMGNLYSVSKAIERLGRHAVVTSDPAEILSAQGAILPGVGAFGDAMMFLRDTGLDQVTREFAQTGKPLIGICLGMQLLFSESEEGGQHLGLNILPGKVVRFQGDYKVPQMGWNRLKLSQSSPLLENVEEGHVYFVHSYHVLAKEQQDVLATTDYYQDVTAIVGRNNIYGAQFHPEKSGVVGMKLLDNFLKLCDQK
jgi:glutamine amidotransferase